MATNFGVKFTYLADTTLTRGTGIQKEMRNRNSSFIKLNGNDTATLYRNLVSFGPVTLKITMLSIVIYMYASKHKFLEWPKNETLLQGPL